MIEKDRKHNSDRLEECIRSFASDDIPKYVTAYQDVIHFAGDTKKGLLLSFLLYLSDRGKRTDGRVYKTYKEMYVATGLSEDQVRSYYKEFESKGFFDWKNKKANGFRTVHFRVNFDAFMRQFREFLGDRYRRSSATATGEFQEPITDNTNINTLYSGASDYEESLDDSSIGELGIVNQRLTAESLLSAISDFEPAGPLPVDFEPTLDNQFHAATTYPQKSTKVVMKAFVNWFSGRRDVKKTPNEWQAEWFKWVDKQNESVGYDESRLGHEREEIIHKTMLVVYELALSSNHRLLNRETYHWLLKTGQERLSKDTVDECLRLLESADLFVKLFGDYYFAKGERRNVLGMLLSGEGDIFHGWNSVDESLGNYISQNRGVSREQIRKKFWRYCQKSIDTYLESGVRSDCLALEGDRYWDGENYPGWRPSEEEIEELMVPYRNSDSGAIEAALSAWR